MEKQIEINLLEHGYTIPECQKRQYNINACPLCHEIVRYFRWDFTCLGVLPDLGPFKISPTKNSHQLNYKLGENTYVT